MAEVAPPLPLEDAVKVANADLDPIMYEDKEPDKVPASKIKSRLNTRKARRTMIKLEKKRRRTTKVATTTGKEGKNPPRFIFDDGGMSFAASSIGNESGISSGSLIRVPTFDTKSFTSRNSRDSKTFGSGRGSKTSRKHYGLSKALEDAASVSSRTSSKYQKSFQDPPAAVLPQGLQFGTPVIMNQSQAFEQAESQLPQVEENEGLLIREREVSLDHYVNKIGNTRFISDDENASGSLLYRKPDELHRDVEAAHGGRKSQSDNSTNEFLNWYVEAERTVRRRKYASGGALIVLLAVAVTLIVVLTGGSSDGGGSNASSSSGGSDSQSAMVSSGDRPVPPRPMPARPPDFNPDNIPLVASDEAFNADTLKAMLQGFSPSSTLEDSSSPAGKAYKWLVDNELEQRNSAQMKQRYVLAVFYYSFQVESWENEAGWLSSDHECTWFGIKCGSDGSNSFPVEGINRRTAEETNSTYVANPKTFRTDDRWGDQVSYINLSDNNLHGKLPEEMKYLTTLVQLILSENFITGGIPEELFSGFHQMHTLYLDKNFMSGQLPDTFNHMDFLRFLDLSGNSFEGPIPKSFQFVDDLVDVRLNNNAFSGKIPDVFAKIPNLSVFIAGSNEMEGSIPPSLAQAPNLVALQLHENELHGSIPSFESTKLNQLHLDSNALTGRIPSLMAFTSASLEEMRLEGNKLSGSVPVEIGDHTSLKLLWLNGNQLKGTIPHELGRLEQMISLQLDGNLLEGSIPDSICALKSGHALSSIRATCSGTNPDLECSCCDSC